MLAVAKTRGRLYKIQNTTDIEEHKSQLEVTKTFQFSVPKKGEKHSKALLSETSKW